MSSKATLGALTPEQVLQSLFGFASFRAPQDSVIEHVLRGDDALVLMPTGAGKSLCYQVPAVILPGVCVVISPLIALMQDQVLGLKRRGISAASLNSSLAPLEVDAIEAALLANEIDVLYVAPERLMTYRMQSLLRRCQVSLFAIDEAHCVSQWGHDFRPEYLELARLAEEWPHVPRLALTATATPQTREEILQRLRMQGATVFSTGFDRPNIHYQVVDKGDVRQQLLSFIRRQHPQQSGIVYVSSRARAQALAGWLTRHGVNALPYHAGLDNATRQANQQRFEMSADLVIVATIAFGMGIDKPGVRFVAHVDMPRSLEHYYQETGRAGRDGLPASAWMAYGSGDVLQQLALVQQAQTNPDNAQRLSYACDAMLDFAESHECRRVRLLAHFGEQSTDCGHCDNCHWRLSGHHPWDATEAAQMVLSAVYRLWRERGQRYGSGHIIDILLGQRTRRVISETHDRLTVFGIGRGLSTLTWRHVIRRLLAQRLLIVDDEGYSTLALTPASVAILKGERRLFMRATWKDGPLEEFAAGVPATAA